MGAKEMGYKEMEEELLKVKMSNIIFFIVLYIILLSSVFL